MSFASPAVLFALAALPAIWWLLRLTPPRPRAAVFPPARIVSEIAQKEETSARTPWWLTALRLGLAALLIVALAGPTLQSTVEEAPGDGPLLLVIDNSWATAPNWIERRDAALAVVAFAEAADRPVALVATAEQPNAIVSPTDPTEIADRILSLEPHPFGANTASLLPQLTTIAEGGGFGGAAWFSDGLSTPESDALAAFLAEFVDGPVIIYQDPAAVVLGLLPPTNEADSLSVEIVRNQTGTSAVGTVVARDFRGRAIAQSEFNFNVADTRSTATFDLPPELRNEIARLEIDGLASAGAVQLLDDRYRRRSVAIISGDAGDQPLLSAEYYLSRALSPFADLRTPTSTVGIAIADMIAAGTSVIILADVGTLTPEAEAELGAWLENGGTLIRFAGPRLAAAESALLPVTLREGGRVLGGALQWEQPQPLGLFPTDSPFFGLDIPDDVNVEVQVLAQPNAMLPDRTWAALADGTPLVTGARSGDGLSVLFHVTADTSWSNLPLSGVFVEMLRRILGLAVTTVSDVEAFSEAALPPFRLLDGYGRLVDPTGLAEPIPGGFAEIAVDASHPPGLYGTDDAFRSLSLLDDTAELAPLSETGTLGATQSPYPGAAPTLVAPWLFAVAFLFLLADTFAVLWLSGSFRRYRPQIAAVAIVGLLFPAIIPDADAQEGLAAADLFALEAANRPALAYVLTGDSYSDDIARAGLTGLSWILNQRTSFEPATPIGVDIATDELAFFPILYWRVSPDAVVPDPTALLRLDAYLRSGGIVLFDTADELQRAGAEIIQGTTAAGDRLREILATFDIPPLEPVPADHVLTKTYYLLDDFPGRYNEGDFWVEALPPAQEGEIRPVRPADGVSPILITSNDLAAAWAIEDDGAYMFPMATTDPRQREFAFRAGVNIVMYALTGNYKTDQVHIPDLLERLGQ